MKWEKADDLQRELRTIARYQDFSHILIERIFCYRSTGSKTRAYARIWSYPKIFQEVLHTLPAYVIEAVSERFNRLDRQRQRKVLIHELLHIPKNFSGSLLPHAYGKKIIGREVEKIFKKLR